ncbi:MAG: hypothetical protein K1X35_01130 [Caulobacteraceae bacterium]|nr:hypothetical protein [Caulobacteraceae bacterium]
MSKPALMDAPLHASHKLEPLYAQAVGRATYAFAVLEWSAIWCCKALDDDYVREMHRTTAGEVAEDFERLIATRPLHDLQLKNELADAAEAFRRLVRVRNALAHAQPGHDATGRCILVNGTRPWQLEGILDAVEAFERCAGRLQRLLSQGLGEKA